MSWPRRTLPARHRPRRPIHNQLILIPCCSALALSSNNHQLFFQPPFYRIHLRTKPHLHLHCLQTAMLLCWFRDLYHHSLRHVSPSLFISSPLKPSWSSNLISSTLQTSLPSQLHPNSQPSLPNRQRSPSLWLRSFSQRRKIPNRYSNRRYRSICWNTSYVT